MKKPKEDTFLIDHSIRCRTLLYLAPIGISIIDPKNNIIVANKALLEILGITKEGLKNQQYKKFKYLYSDGRVLTFNELPGFLTLNKRRIIKDFVVGIVNNEKKTKWVEVSIAPLDKDRNFTAVIAHDITDRKHLQNKLGESETKYRALYENSTDAIFLTMPDGTVCAANPAACNMLKMSEDEICSRGRNGVVDRSDPHLEEALKERSAKGMFCGELIMVRKNGEKFPVEISSSVFTSSDGKQMTSMIVRDITQHKETEEKILNAKNLLEATFNSLTEAVFIIDSKTRVVLSANKSVEKIFGYSIEEVIGENTEILHVDKEHYEDFGKKSAIKLNSEGIFKDDNFFMKRKNGEVFPTMHTVNEVINKEGIRTNVLSVVKDISDRKNAEKKIRQSEQQLRVLTSQLIEGHEQERKYFARELHDEVGQSLNAMRFNLSLLEKDPDPNINPEFKLRISETNRILETVLSQVHSMSLNLHPAIIDDLGLLPAIREYISQFKKRTNLKVVFQSKLDKRLNPEIEINLYRVLQETLTNIAKHSQAKNVHIHLNVKKSSLSLIIQDDGKGFIMKEMLNLRKTDGGMGIRSMNERITFLSGGMDIISSPGKGTKIEISIPLTDK